MSNLVTITPPSIDDEYEQDFTAAVAESDSLINSWTYHLTLDEIKEAFAEAAKKYENLI